MVGITLVEKLRSAGYRNLLLAPHSELELRDQVQTFDWFEKNRPEIVVHAAAKVGGIEANRTHMGEFLYDNLVMACNVFEASRRVGAAKVLFIASSCMYPRDCPQPMREEDLMTGPLEPTNEGYAIAKIAGMKLAQTYTAQYGMNCVTAVPCNLYGPNDDFDPVNSHVLSALVRKFVTARDANEPSVTMWGTGVARRELMHVADVASAIVLLMDMYDSSDAINVGPGDDISISELANLVSEAAGYRGEINWDPSKPDGMPRKLMDSSGMRALGWTPHVTLKEGVKEMVALYEKGNHG